MHVGGGIGQLCNAIPYDDKHDEVILVAMNNEVNNANDAKEFVYTISTGIEKVQSIANTHTTTVVLPPVPAVTPEALARVSYIEHKFKEVQNEKLRVLTVDDVEYDASLHPSPAGTKSIIHQIQAAVGEVIILPDA